MRRAADDVGAPVGLVLEGGYDLGALSRSMAALMPVLLADDTPAAEELAVHPLARRAAAGRCGAGADRYFAGTIRRVEPPPAWSRILASAACASRLRS